MKKVKLFSDGSCLKNPGVGGWAFILESGEHSLKDSGGEENTTNNRMEIQAVINGLKALKSPCEVELYTDSQYVQRGLNEWLANWVKKNFKDVKNPELWKELLALSKVHKINAFWVKGHAGHPQNELCDDMARAEAVKISESLNKNEKTIKSQVKNPELQKFEKILNYNFSNENLLIEALTHKSVKADYNNERLEFLGDAVLDLVVGEFLYKKFRGKHNEGNLSKLRAALVNEDSFAQIAKRIHIGDFLFLSLAENKNGGREKSSLLSDALEAVMGAIYLESGLDRVKEIFLNLLDLEFPKITLSSLVKDYKTSLQEFTQAHFGSVPSYELLGSSGPDHKKTFEMALFLNGKEIAKAVGASKKEAEQKAASIALELLKKEE